jgi:hypothetical protein
MTTARGDVSRWKRRGKYRSRFAVRAKAPAAVGSLLEGGSWEKGEEWRRASARVRASRKAMSRWLQ